jgi:hypothetical protein
VGEGRASPPRGIKLLPRTPTLLPVLYLNQFLCLARIPVRRLLLCGSYFFVRRGTTVIVGKLFAQEAPQQAVPGVFCEAPFLVKVPQVPVFPSHFDGRGLLDRPFIEASSYWE